MIDARHDDSEMHADDDVNLWIERSIRDSDWIVCVCTPEYKARFDERDRDGGFEFEATQLVRQRQSGRGILNLVASGNDVIAVPRVFSNRPALTLEDASNAAAEARQPEIRASDIAALVSRLRRESRLPPLGSPIAQTAPAEPSESSPAEPARPSWASEMGRDDHGVWARALEAGHAIRFRYVAPGSFWMGAPDDDPEATSHDRPRHLVTLTRGYWIAERPCTTHLWRTIMGGSTSPAETPVTGVSWADAVVFTQRLARQCPDAMVRLPTEAEWELACGPGPLAGSPSDAWHSGRGVASAQATGRVTPNARGLFDMLGNVWEWCADWHASYSAEAQVDPRGPAQGSTRVVRGGSWADEPRLLRPTRRHAFPPERDYPFVGFRCVIEA
jgi:formylglycine-generating enzyme required for sulfatase activity